MSSEVLPETMGFRSDRRRDHSSNSIRRQTRRRSFRNRVVRLARETNRECAEAEKGKRSSSTCSDVRIENFMRSMQKNHGEKVRCLIKMMRQQLHLFKQIDKSPIVQLQARRFRSLFALAQHLDTKSVNNAAKFELDACREPTSAKEPEHLPAI